MKTLSQLQAEHEKAVQELTRQHAIAESLPILPDTVQINGTRAPWAIYRGRKTLAEALDVFRAFVVVPMRVFRGTFCSVCPDSELSARERERVTDERGPFACLIRVHEGEKFGPSAEMQFYAFAPHGVIAVHVAFGAGYIGTCHALRADWHIVRDRSGSRIIEKTARANPTMFALSDHRISWASGDTGPVKHSADFSYLFSSDQDETGPGAECSHALGQLQNAADILKI